MIYWFKMNIGATLILRWSCLFISIFTKDISWFDLKLMNLLLFPQNIFTCQYFSQLPSIWQLYSICQFNFLRFYIVENTTLLSRFCIFAWLLGLTSHLFSIMWWFRPCIHISSESIWSHWPPWPTYPSWPNWPPWPS